MLQEQTFLSISHEVQIANLLRRRRPCVRSQAQAMRLCVFIAAIPRPALERASAAAIAAQRPGVAKSPVKL